MPPSRQERRKAERDAAKRAPARAGAAGAGGAAAALANLNVNPLGDWTTQNADQNVMFQALGVAAVKRKASEGDREAQFSQVMWLMPEAEGGVGELGASGRAPQADVGTALCMYPNVSSQDRGLLLLLLLLFLLLLFLRILLLRLLLLLLLLLSLLHLSDPTFCFAGANPKRRRAWRFWRRRQGKGTHTPCTCWGVFTT